jgi:ATP:ADP antiporter, AAA family
LRNCPLIAPARTGHLACIKLIEPRSGFPGGHPAEEKPADTRHKENILKPLASLLPLRRDEAPTVLLIASYFFLAMSSVVIVKSLQYAFYLDEVGFDWRLPLLYGFSALISAPIVILYRVLARRHSQVFLVTVTLVFFAASLLFFALTLRQADSGAYFMVFYLWAGLFVLLIPTLGWVIAYGLFTTRDSKRLFGLLGTGGILGGAAGGYWTTLMAARMGVILLLLQVLVILVLLQLIVLVLKRHRIDKVAPKGQQASPTAEIKAQGAAKWFQSPYLRYIAVLVLFSGSVTTLIDLNYVWFLNQRYPESTEDFARFFSTLLGTMFLLSAVVQFFLTAPVLRRYGAAAVLVAPPAGLAFGSGFAALFPGFWPAVFLKGMDGTLRPSLHRTALEVLYVPAAGPQSMAFKSFMELVVFKGGDALGALLFLLISSTLLSPARMVAATVASATCLWLYVAFLLGREYLKNLRSTLEVPAFDRNRAVLSEDLDAETALIDLLRSSDPVKVRLALERLANLAPEASELMLPEGQETLQTGLSGIYSREPAWLKIVEPLMNHPDPEVGVSALQLLIRHDPMHYFGLLREALETEHFPSLACLLYLDKNVEQPALFLKVPFVLKWCQAIGPEQAHILARIMGRSRNPAFLAILRQWLASSQIEFVRAAAEGLGLYGETRFLGELTSLLGHRRTRQAARKGLAASGEKAVDHLSALLVNPSVDPAVKQEIPLILREIQSSSARSRLLTALYLPDPVVSYRALKALNKTRATMDLSYTTESFLPLLTLWAKQYYRIANLQSVLDPTEGAESALLLKTTEERAFWTIERIFRTLELFLPSGDAYLSYLAFTSDKRALRDNAIELIELRLRGDVKKIVLPIFSERNSKAVAAAGRRLFGLPSKSEAILQDSFFEADPILKACILATMKKRIESFRETVAHSRSEIHPLVRETAQWVLSEPGPEKVDHPMLTTVEKILLLKDLEIFRHAATDHLALVASVCTEESAEAGTLLFQSGEPPRCVHLLVEGEVRLQGEQGSDIVQRSCALNLWPCLAGTPYDVQATCVTKCRLLLLPSEELFDVLSSEADLSLAILRQVAASFSGGKS